MGVGVEQVRLVTMQNKLIGLLSGTFTAIRGKNTWGTGLSWVAGMVGQFGPAALAGAGFMLLAGWGVNLLYKKSIYKTEPLRNGTQKLLGAETSMFGSSIRLQRQRSTRVAVMCMKDAVQVSAIANYNRPLTGNNLACILVLVTRANLHVQQVPSQQTIVVNMSLESQRQRLMTSSELRMKRTN